jgi:hypothetical protein
MSNNQSSKPVSKLRAEAPVFIPTFNNNNNVYNNNQYNNNEYNNNNTSSVNSRFTENSETGTYKYRDPQLAKQMRNNSIQYELSNPTPQFHIYRKNEIVSEIQKMYNDNDNPRKYRDISTFVRIHDPIFSQELNKCSGTYAQLDQCLKYKIEEYLAKHTSKKGGRRRKTRKHKSRKHKTRSNRK